MDPSDWLRKNSVIIRSRVTNIEAIIAHLFQKNIISLHDSEKIRSPYKNVTTAEKWDEISNILSRKSIMISIPILETIFRETENEHIIHITRQKAGMPEMIVGFEKEERDAIRGDFRVQNHHCVPIALKLADVQGLSDNWDMICTKILTPRAIANLENERNFETKIMRTIQAWIGIKGRDATYNLLVQNIGDVNNPAGDALEEIRKELSGFSRT